MTDWTSGYVADIGYTYGYYVELNPQRVRLALLNAGLALPPNGAACELGFGQGLSINMHATATRTRWFGTDFNPSQAGFAYELASAADCGTQVYDESFVEFCNRPDLPEFSYIGLHGIWSWVSDENRSVIVDFIRRKLKVGGVLYLSYNTLPGWAAFAPMRHLLTQHAELIGAEGHGITSRINGALEFALELLANNPAYTRAYPAVADRLKNINGQSRHYLAHEYFNRDWHPMHFATVADVLSSSKVTFACSAHYMDHIDAVNLTDEQQVFLGKIPDPQFKESVRDFIVNQQFRRDYWVKGPRRLSSLERVEALQKERVILVTARQDVPLTFAGAVGEATMNETVYGPILDFLGDYVPKTLGQIEEAMKDKGILISQIIEVVMLLAGAGHIAPVQDKDEIEAARVSTEKLNRYLIDKARGSGEIGYLVSPVTGGGISVGRFQQLFLASISRGDKSSDDWAKFAWATISAQGQKIVKDGQALKTAEENLTELALLAKVFAEKKLPVLKALLVA